MNNNLLIFNKKHTDTLIEQTKTKPEETPEFKMNKQMETLSCNPPIILFDEGKLLLGKTSFECINKSFIMNNENNSFSIIMSGHWNSEPAEKPLTK